MSRYLPRALAHVQNGVEELKAAKQEVPEDLVPEVTFLRAHLKLFARRLDELRRTVEADVPPPAA